MRDTQGHKDKGKCLEGKDQKTRSMMMGGLGGKEQEWWTGRVDREWNSREGRSGREEQGGKHRDGSTGRKHTHREAQCGESTRRDGQGGNPKDSWTGRK